MTNQKNSLEMIYSLVLGIIFTIFIGVGINTFYPYPSYTDSRLTEISKQESSCYKLYNSYSDSSYQKEQSCLDKYSSEREKIQTELENKRKAWGINTSIILLSIATLTIALSLLLSESLHIISNGLMLGSFFVLIGGVGSSFFSDQKVIRFVIITISLIITTGIGYFVFIKKKNISMGSKPFETVPTQNMVPPVNPEPSVTLANNPEENNNQTNNQ